MSNDAGEEEEGGEEKAQTVCSRHRIFRRFYNTSGGGCVETEQAVQTLMTTGAMLAGSRFYPTMRPSLFPSSCRTSPTLPALVALVLIIIAAFHFIYHRT